MSRKRKVKTTRERLSEYLKPNDGTIKITLELSALGKAPSDDSDELPDGAEEDAALDALIPSWARKLYSEGKRSSE